MNIKEITIPKGTRYITDTLKLDSRLPTTGKCILNKTLTGCGITSYYLENDLPVILLSPRRELLVSKKKKYTDNIYWYKDNTKRDKVGRTCDNKVRENLYNYLQKSYLNKSNLADTNTNGLIKPIIPKVCVTYDSFPSLVEYLKYIGYLDRFTLLVDEMQALLTDSSFKAGIELQTIENITALPNRTIFVSATPFSEAYLDNLEYFKDLPYYKLKWSKEDTITVPINYKATNKTPKEIVSELVNNYRDKGYFTAKPIDTTNILYSKEASIYLNDINEIRRIIRDLKLKDEEVAVICADTNYNQNRLNSIGISGISHFNSEEDRDKNKPFTFITRASFEGSDQYSKSTSTYIFSNPNTRTLALDLAIDLTQIIGRCRSDDNPFRYDINFFFRTVNGAIGNIMPYLENEDTYKEYITGKLEDSERIYKDYLQCSQTTLKDYYNRTATENKARTNYFEVIQLAGKYEPRINYLAYQNDLRAYDIYKNQYRCELKALKSIEKAGLVTEIENQTIKELYRICNGIGAFEEKFKLFCDYLDNHTEDKAQVYNSNLIPHDYKLYHCILGSSRCKALSYHEVYLKDELALRQKELDITDRLKSAFKSGTVVATSEAKRVLAGIYKQLGIVKKAKATNVCKYIAAKETKFIDSNGKQQRGIRIL